jgi:hypothetical protein
MRGWHSPRIGNYTIALKYDHTLLLVDNQVLRLDARRHFLRRKDGKPLAETAADVQPLRITSFFLSSIERLKNTRVFNVSTAPDRQAEEGEPS